MGKGPEKIEIESGKSLVPEGTPREQPVFLGRKAELKRWGETLGKRGGHLITIGGPHGIGKSCLAEKFGEKAMEIGVPVAGIELDSFLIRRSNRLDSEIYFEPIELLTKVLGDLGIEDQSGIGSLQELYNEFWFKYLAASQLAAEEVTGSILDDVDGLTDTQKFYDRPSWYDKLTKVQLSFQDILRDKFSQDQGVIIINEGRRKSPLLVDFLRKLLVEGLVTSGVNVKVVFAGASGARMSGLPELDKTERLTRLELTSLREEDLGDLDHGDKLRRMIFEVTGGYPAAVKAMSELIKTGQKLDNDTVADCLSAVINLKVLYDLKPAELRVVENLALIGGFETILVKKLADKLYFVRDDDLIGSLPLGKELETKDWAKDWAVDESGKLKMPYGELLSTVLANEPELLSKYGLDVLVNQELETIQALLRGLEDSGYIVRGDEGRQIDPEIAKLLRSYSLRTEPQRVISLNKEMIGAMEKLLDEKPDIGSYMVEVLLAETRIQEAEFYTGERKRFNINILAEELGGRVRRIQDSDTQEQNRKRDAVLKKISVNERILSVLGKRRVNRLLRLVEL